MSEKKKTCFMAMPITVHGDQEERYAGDNAHWSHVMETLFEPAIRKAGFEPIRPAAVGSHMIHAEIVRNLSEADLVLVDLSSHNPNVFFELGVRTSLNLPIALVADEHTTLPFDTAGINTHRYASTLKGWEVEQQVGELQRHVEASWTSCRGTNPLWRHFGLVLTASEPSTTGDPTTAKLDLLAEGITRLEQVVFQQSATLNANLALPLQVPDDPYESFPPQEVLAMLQHRLGHDVDVRITKPGTNGRRAIVVNLNKVPPEDLSAVKAKIREFKQRLANNAVQILTLGPVDRTTE